MYERVTEKNGVPNYYAVRVTGNDRERNVHLFVETNA